MEYHVTSKYYPYEFMKPTIIIFVDYCAYQLLLFWAHTLSRYYLLCFHVVSSYYFCNYYHFHRLMYQTIFCNCGLLQLPITAKTFLQFGAVSNYQLLTLLSCSHQLLLLQVNVLTSYYIYRLMYTTIITFLNSCSYQ